MVEGAGFEPAKAEPSDLQSDPFDRSGTPPYFFDFCLRGDWSWREESNPRPADYKSAALPTELRQHNIKKPIGEYYEIPNQNTMIVFTLAANYS